MVDRRNLTIPINLAFLAVLLAISVFVTDMPPAQVAEKKMPVPPADAMPAPPAPSAETPPSAGQPSTGQAFAGQAVRLSALSMPPLPELPVAAAESRNPPVEEIQRQERPVEPQPVPEPTSLPVAELKVPSVLGLPDPLLSALARSEPELPPIPPLVPASADMKPPVVTPPAATPLQPLPMRSPPARSLQARSLQARLLPVQPLPALESLQPSMTPKTRPVAPKPDLTPSAKAPRGALPASASDNIIPLRPATDKVPDRKRMPGSTPPPVMPIEVATAARARPVTAATKPQDIRPGAVDLQMAERLMDSQDQALSLEFLWPADRRSHSRIYANLTQCLGVETGVIDRNRQVHLGAGGGRSFNTAFHSPFMRLVDQPVDPRERRIIERLRTGQHLDAGGGMAVRVFRRAHDMRLLAALNRAFGGLPLAGRVTAEYEMEGNSLYLVKLTLDGRPYDGRVRLGRDGCA